MSRVKSLRVSPPYLNSVHKSQKLYLALEGGMQQETRQLSTYYTCTVSYYNTHHVFKSLSAAYRATHHTKRLLATSDEVRGFHKYKWALSIYCTLVTTGEGSPAGLALGRCTSNTICSPRPSPHKTATDCLELPPYFFVYAVRAAWCWYFLRMRMSRGCGSFCDDAQG